MGRGKLKMQLIANERSRMVTYYKRKKGLTKKVQEFHILCDVDVCVIILGPESNNRPTDVESWPSDHKDFRRIINRYRSASNERKKTQDLSHFFEARQKKIDDEIAKVQKACMETKYPRWDNRLNEFHYHELEALAAALNSKLEVANNRILTAKGGNYLLGSSNKSGITHQGSSSNNINITKLSSSMAATFANALRKKSMEFQLHKQQPLFSSVNQFDDQNLQQIVPFNVNSPMLTMMGNGENLTHFGCESSSNSLCYYDPAIDQTAGNLMMWNNNARVHHPISYYGVSNKHELLMHNIVSSSPQMGIPQSSDFCNDIGIDNNKKLD